MSKKIFTSLLVLFILCGVAFFLTAPETVTAADQDYGLGAFRDKLKNVYSEDNPYNFVANLIHWTLGIIGVVLLAMIIYGGVMYMTAAGSEDRARTGKAVLTYAIIGVIIIFASWVIADYVMSTFTSVPSNASKIPGADQPEYKGKKNADDWDFFEFDEEEGDHGSNWNTIEDLFK